MTDEFRIGLIASGASIAGGLIGGLVSGTYQHARDTFSGPRLEIDYEGAPGNRVDLDYRLDAKTHVFDTYIRARVQNKGRLGAKGVRVFLAGLKEVQNSNLIETTLHDPLVLSWPGWEFAAQDIPRGIEMYVDVVRVSREPSLAGWNFSVKQLFARQDTLKLYSGTYRFYLMATAENATPSLCELDITYRQDWNSLRAIEHKRRSLLRSRTGS